MELITYGQQFADECTGKEIGLVWFYGISTFVG